MRWTFWANCLFTSSLLFSICACGGSSPKTTVTPNDPPPPLSTTEILYASNLANTLLAFRIDQTTGALTQTAMVAPGGQSVENSVLAIAPAGTYLYAVNNVNSAIDVYATGKSGDLSLTPDSPFPILPALQPPWATVTALTIDPKGRFLYAGTGAGFTGVASFSINGTTGALAPTGGPFSTGIGTMPAKIATNPAGTFLYSTDLNQSVWAFAIGQLDGTLTPIAGSPFNVGSQPNALQIDPSGKYLYVALTNSNAIAALGIDSSSGVLTTVPGSPFPTASIPFTQISAISIHPSGKFLYAFNFNGNTVAAFMINSANGVLSPIVGSPFAVSPNAEGDMIVDSSGKYLYLTIGFAPPSDFVIFDIDATTGALTPNLESPVPGADEPAGLAVVQFH